MIRSIKLKDASKQIGSGLTPLRSNPLFWVNGTIPWLKTEQLNEYKIYDTSEKITQFAVEATSIKKYPAKTLSIAMYGEGKTRGNIAILMKEMTTNQACCNIILDENLANFEYVYYYLKTQYSQLRNLSSGVRKNLNSNDIKEFTIRLPEDLLVQQKIASVLASLDYKIELNDKINAELEQMAKALYYYWFVQFDFPNLKGKPFKSSGGKMVWNEELKREIPVGWELKELMDIEENIVTGKTPSTNNQNYFNGDIPFITIGDIRGHMYVVDTEINLSDEGAATQKNKFIPAGSLCVTCIASPGLIGFSTKDSQTNQQINTIVFNNENNKMFLYFALNDYFKFSSGAKTGNTFANMNKEDFGSIRLITPPQSILSHFNNITKPISKKIFANTFENQKLSELRDWLLPMLMNGQVTVN